MKRLNMKQALVIGLFFGGFQALMPFLGWALGTQLADFITPIDHWIAFILLAIIGGKMLLDAIRGGDEEDAGEPKDTSLDFKELLMLAIATSIDALAVGITFAFLGVNIVWAMVIIGVTTLVLSVIGVAVGHAFGARYEKGATIVGGVVLILIGCKILLEHLGVLAL
nr:manganese efflux pump MntP family protein [uncultured Ellagibacter sp.]